MRLYLAYYFLFLELRVSKMIKTSHANKKCCKKLPTSAMLC